jgi:hemoglobin
MKNRAARLALMLTFAAGIPVAQAATLFDDMGGATVLHTAVDRFTDIVIADPRINFTFADTDLGKFKALLYEQLCQLSDGPCTYTGRDMATAHKKLMIDTAEFNALAEDLYLALGESGVSYRLQNKLMAKLAPMKRDIVKKRP